MLPSSEVFGDDSLEMETEVSLVLVCFLLGFCFLVLKSRIVSPLTLLISGCVDIWEGLYAILAFISKSDLIICPVIIFKKVRAHLSTI